MASKEIGFTAKKDTPASETDVTNKRVLIAPPSEDFDGKIINGTINFGIDGVAPIEVTPDEMDIFWKWATPIAERAPNLKDVTPETDSIAVIP